MLQQITIIKRQKKTANRRKVDDNRQSRHKIYKNHVNVQQAYRSFNPMAGCQLPVLLEDF